MGNILRKNDGSMVLVHGFDKREDKNIAKTNTDYERLRKYRRGYIKTTDENDLVENGQLRHPISFFGDMKRIKFKKHLENIFDTFFINRIPVGLGKNIKAVGKKTLKSNEELTDAGKNILKKLGYDDEQITKLKNEMEISKQLQQKIKKEEL